MESLQTEQSHVIEMASEKGASNWLTALPLKRYGFTLTKSEFRDFALDITLRPKICPLIVHHVVESLPYHMLSTVRGGGGIHT